MQAVARRFVLSPEVLGGLAAEPATLPVTADHLRATFETPEAAEAFVRDLRAEAERLARLHGAPQDASPDRHVVVLAVHPSRPQVQLPEPRIPD